MHRHAERCKEGSSHPSPSRRTSARMPRTTPGGPNFLAILRIALQRPISLQSRLCVRAQCNQSRPAPRRPVAELGRRFPPMPDRTSERDTLSRLEMSEHARERRASLALPPPGLFVQPIRNPEASFSQFRVELPLWPRQGMSYDASGPQRSYTFKRSSSYFVGFSPRAKVKRKPAMGVLPGEYLPWPVLARRANAFPVRVGGCGMKSIAGTPRAPVRGGGRKRTVSHVLGSPSITIAGNLRAVGKMSRGVSAEGRFEVVQGRQRPSLPSFPVAY